MAGFSDTPDSYDRVDWDLLQNGPVNLYWRPEILNDDSQWLAQHGYTVHTFDASRWNTEVEMHLDIQPALGFPEYYGHNLNALNDCLSDVAIAEDVGLALAFTHFDAFAERNPAVAHALLNIIANNSRRVLLLGKRLIALLQSDSSQFRTGPLGATYGNWNRHEWQPSTRRRKADELFREPEPPAGSN